MKHKYLILSNGKKIKVGPNTVAHTKAKLSSRKLIELLRKASQKGLFILACIILFPFFLVVAVLLGATRR